MRRFPVILIALVLAATPVLAAPPVVHVTPATCTTVSWRAPTIQQDNSALTLAITSYRVWASATEGSQSTMATPTATVTPPTTSVAVPAGDCAAGITTYFVITAVDSSGESIRTPICGASPATPTYPGCANELQLVVDAPVAPAGPTGLSAP